MIGFLKVFLGLISALGYRGGMTKVNLKVLATMQCGEPDMKKTSRLR
jgi:hypothetical protein